MNVHESQQPELGPSTPPGGGNTPDVTTQKKLRRRRGKRARHKALVPSHDHTSKGPEVQKPDSTLLPPRAPQMPSVADTLQSARPGPKLGATNYFGPNAKVVKPIEFAVGAPFYLPKGYVSIIAGQGGVGKSTIAALLAVSVATGQPFLDAETKQGYVLYLDFEAGEDGTIPVIKHVANGMGVGTAELDGKVRYVSFVEEGKRLPAVAKEVLEAIDAYNIGVVVVDAWQAAFGGDAKGAEVVTEHMRVLKQIAAKGVAVVVLDHVAKPQQDVSSKTPFGSVYKTNLARSVHVISQPDEHQPDRLQWEVTKLNVGKKSEPFVIERQYTDEGISFSRAGAPRIIFGSKTKEIQAAVDSLFSERLAAELKRQDILKHVMATVQDAKPAYAEKIVDEHLDNLVARNELEKLVLPGQGRPTAYRVAVPLELVGK